MARRFANQADAPSDAGNADLPRDRFTQVQTEAAAIWRNGMLLIDELETAIHISALGNAFRWMIDACKLNNVQLFATTHSLEAIDSLLAADETPACEDIVGYRLEATGQTVTVRRYGEDLLHRLRIERGVEVR